MNIGHVAMIIMTSWSCDVKTKALGHVTSFYLPRPAHGICHIWCMILSYTWVSVSKHFFLTQDKESCSCVHSSHHHTTYISVLLRSAVATTVLLGAMGLDWPIACRISALLAGGIITYNGAAEEIKINFIKNSLLSKLHHQSISCLESP